MRFLFYSSSPLVEIPSCNVTFHFLLSVSRYLLHIGLVIDIRRVNEVLVQKEPPVKEQNTGVKHLLVCLCWNGVKAICLAFRLSIPILPDKSVSHGFLRCISFFIKLHITDNWISFVFKSPRFPFSLRLFRLADFKHFWRLDDLWIPSEFAREMGARQPRCPLRMAHFWPELTNESFPLSPSATSTSKPSLRR